MELVLDIVISVVSVIVIGQYTWAGRGHFSSERMPRGAVLISVVVLLTGCFFLYLTWAVSQPPTAQLAGLVLQLFSWWLFWRAIAASREAKLRLAFDEAGPHGLVNSGPYRFVRHPFYSSYVAFWAGWTLAIWSAVAVAPFLILLAIYIVAARTEEGRFAASSMATEYEAYKRQTGFFLPKVTGSR
jgi:protein-S-isoprenylcysteine O-methyltransferase Ste14